MSAAQARIGAFAAMLLLVTGQSVVGAQPTSSSVGCVAQGRHIYKGMKKRVVKSIAGGAGLRLGLVRGAEVRSYPMCEGLQAVIVKFRKGKVASSKTMTVAMAADIDGNGTQDYYFDANADGKYESAVLDRNGNGVFETFFIQGTTHSIIFGDPNENGYIEYAAIQVNATGNVPWVIVDQNEDGVADRMAVDLVGNDGIADTWVNAANPATYTPPGLSADQTRQVNDLMVRQIVTMQQLRQFDPWDVNYYVPNGQTPSLLLPNTSPYRGCGAFCTL